ncbi:hypothetical protein [Actinomadura fibrosa]|uniref:DUF946 domain-containing protein n=1 Tax=Actinomadura fibrosa TaxID=111802 RepID=A0ABW2XVX2_9ACTN|nr:hypothetical protein [Actinomadura fibrosa]
MTSPRLSSPAAQTYWYDYGELRVAFTSQFALDYQDEKSGATMYGRFWHPVLPQWAVDDGGWCWLGGMSWPCDDYDGDPGGYRVGVIVKDHGGSGVLAAPTGWTECWSDDNTGATMYGKVYRAVPPDGYVTLGDIFTGGGSDWVTPDSGKAPWNTFRCVRADYTHTGSYGQQLWNTDGAGARPAEETIWSINTDLNGQTFSQQADHALLGITGFTGKNGRSDSAPTDPPPLVLMVPVPQITVNAPPAPPSLTSYDPPAEHTTPVNDYSVVVPFGAITDTELTVDQHVNGNAFYTLKHYIGYENVCFINNQHGAVQSEPQSVALDVGVTAAQSQTYSASYGVTVGYDTGVEAGVEGDFFSADGHVSFFCTTSRQLGYSTTTQVQVMASETVTNSLSAPANANAAMWGRQSTIAPCRPDGTCIDPNGGLTFTDHTTVVDSTFP